MQLQQYIKQKQNKKNILYISKFFLYFFFLLSTHLVSHFLPKHSDYPIEFALTKWRETLVLLLVNRNEYTDDAINKLGNLLKENGWKDAADIW